MLNPLLDRLAFLIGAVIGLIGLVVLWVVGLVLGTVALLLILCVRYIFVVLALVVWGWYLYLTLPYVIN